MSDENAVPEVPAEAPAAEPLKSEATPGTWVSGQPETFTPAADDLASRIAALEPVAQALLTETLNHVLDGFINHSLVLGMTRLTGLLK